MGDAGNPRRPGRTTRVAPQRPPQEGPPQEGPPQEPAERGALPAGPPFGHTGAMGFNPHLKSDKTPADYLLVAVALIVCAGLVIWGILG